MTDEDKHSAIIAITKQRMHSERSTGFVKQKNNKRIPDTCRTSKDVAEKFSLPVIKPVPVSTFKKSEFLLPYIHYSKSQEEEKKLCRKKIGLRNEYRAINDDLQKRLHTDDPPDDCRTITEVDSDFYTCVSGSTLTGYVAPYKSLKHFLNKRLMIKQEIGIRRDCMLNIEINYRKEREIYEASIKRFKKQVRYFDEFVSDDYKKSMVSLNKLDELQVAVRTQTCELQCLAAKEFTVVSRLVGLDYRYRLQQKYGRFLYYLSPPSWRYRNRNFARSMEIEAKGFDFTISSEEDSFDIMFENLQTDCNSGLIKPVLYFKHHGELMKIFNDIEQQHLHHFVHVVQLTPLSTFLKKGIKLLRDIIAQDSAGILSTIDKLQRMLEYSETRQTQLQNKFFKILNGLFYESVGTQEASLLKMNLEFCYEKLFNKIPINMEIVGTAKALESFYMDFSMRLDSITSDKIHSAIRQCEKSEKEKFRRAHVAARELKVFKHLERNLLRAFAPPVSRPAHKFTVQHSSRRKI